MELKPDWIGSTKIHPDLNSGQLHDLRPLQTTLSGTVTIEQKGSQHKINDIRLENVVLNSDIYFLDGKRKHSVTNDELGREIII